MTDNNKKTTLKEAFDAELLKRLEKNPPEIPTYEEFSTMVDADLNKQRRRKMRIISIAASLAIVVLASIFAITYLTPDVDADKNPKEEIVTEDGVIIEDGGWGSSDGEDNFYEITDWQYIKMAKEICPELMLPEYVPEGYVFEKLTIEQVETGATTCEFFFIDSVDNTIEIEEVFHTTLFVSTDVSNVIRSINSKKGTMYIHHGEKEIATLQIEDGKTIYIIGMLSDEERIKIVNNLTN